MGENLLAGTHLARQAAAGTDPAWCSLELLRAELAQDEELRESFLSDARRAIGLVASRLVGTRTLVCEEGAYGRTTDWLDGQPLRRVLERVGRAHLPLRLQLWIIGEILAGLEAAEQLGAAADPPAAFVHGALSPDSVFLTYDGQVRLLRVGFAPTLRLLERRLAQLALEPGYVPPERYIGSEATPSADLYAVGALLWEALTQMERALATSVVDVSRPRDSDETPSVQEICPQAPERLKHICDRALAVNPGERYPNALALRGEIEGFLADTCAAGEPEPGPAALAELLLKHFAPERTTMQSLIERHTSRFDISSTRVEEVAADAAATDASRATSGANDPVLTRFIGEGSDDGTYTVTSFEEEPPAPATAPAPAPVLPAVSLPAPSLPTVSLPAVSVPAGSLPELPVDRVSGPRTPAPAPRRLVRELRRLSGTALGVAGILALFAFAFYGVPRVREPESRAPSPPSGTSLSGERAPADNGGTAAPVVRSALLPAPARNPAPSAPKPAEDGLDAGSARSLPEARHSPEARESPAPLDLVQLDLAPLVRERESGRARAETKAAPAPRATGAINEPRWKTQFKKILRSAAPHPVPTVEPLPIDEADPYSR